MDFDTAVRDFLIDLQFASRTAGTRKKHEQELKRLGVWYAAQPFVWQATGRKELQQYVRTRAHLGASARGNALCTLRVFFAWCCEQELLPSSPAAGLKTPVRARPLPKALNKAQTRALLVHVADLRASGHRRAQRDAALIVCGLYAGLRASELAALRWPDVDLDALVIGVRLSKMNKGRSIPMHGELAGVLRWWKELQALDQAAPVFALDQVAIRPARVGKVVRRIGKELALPLTAHILRHTFATWTLRRSRDLYGVSRALGHSRIGQTEVYVSADADMIRGTVGALPELGDW